MVLKPRRDAWGAGDFLLDNAGEQCIYAFGIKTYAGVIQW